MDPHLPPAPAALLIHRAVEWLEARHHESVTPELLPPSADMTKVISEHPRIVLSDTRYDNAPCFLYLPDARADLVFVDCLPNLREVAQWPVWRRPAPVPPHSEAGPSFVVQDVPGKGMGMLAARPIRAGELIWEERPIYAARRTLSCAADQTDANGIFHRAALQGLAPAARTAFLRLANAYPPREFDAVPGILNTNCLEIRIADPDAGAPDVDAGTFAGCFPTLARANHACAPSANYHFSVARFAGQLWAARDIVPGEEVTIAYAPLAAPCAERRAFLARTRYFVCACPVCALPPAQVQASDARRVGIRQLLARLEGERFPPRIPFEQLREALDWAGEEGLPVEYARILMGGSQVLTIYHDLRVAMEWARRARSVFEMVEGEDSYNVRRLDDADRVHGLMASGGRTLKM